MPFPNLHRIATHNCIPLSFLGSRLVLLAAVTLACLASPVATAITLAEWQALYFTPTEINNPAIGGISADPDGDGRSNLIEYAFGMNPRLEDSLPSGYLTSTIGLSGRLTIVYPRLKGADDVIYRVEASGDHVTWQTGPTVAKYIGHYDVGALDLMTFEDQTSLALQPTRFLRVRVDYSANTDSDGDGLPDWWEIQHFGDLSHSATEVASNGFTMLTNYIQGRNPNANSTSSGSGDTSNALIVFTPGF